MSSSAQSVRGPARDRPRVRAETLYGLLFVCLMGGLAASAYSGYEKVNPAATSVCSVNAQISCGKVVNSAYSQTLGVENWVIGLVGYLAMFAVAVLAFRTYERRYLTALAVLSGLGVVVTLWFVYLELGPIGAICLVCTSAHLLNLGVLGATIGLLRLSRPDTEAPGSARETPAAAPGADPD